MNYGEIAFDMTLRGHPTGSQAEYLLKRWKKYTIYSKSGSYNRTDNPLENLYSTSSIYLYDYVVVSEEWYNSVICTASIVSAVPTITGSYAIGQTWVHNVNTFRNSPNLKTNNYIITGSYVPGPTPYHYTDIVNTDQGEYFEIVGSYPRNHFTHKRSLFSLYKLTTYGKTAGAVTSGSYRRCQQTTSTTIGEDGLEDGSSPVNTAQVGNLNLIQTDNVINK